MGRGRPAITRARVLAYWLKHGPCSIGQIVRATGAERSHIKRMLRIEKIDIDRILPPAGGQNGAVTGSSMNGLAFDSYLVGGSAKGATSDELEQRQAIRQMCRYIADDAKVARHHGVTIEKVSTIRAGMVRAKVKGLGTAKTVGGVIRSGQATGADAVNPFTAEERMKDMLRQGSAMLRDAVLDALIARNRVAG